METKTIITFMLSIFGVCASGFFFLSIWIRAMSKDVEAIRLDLKDRVTYAWLEDRFKKDMKEEFSNLEENFDVSMRNVTKEVSKLTEAVIGTVDKKGMLTKVHEHESRISKAEDKCQKTHG